MPAKKPLAAQMRMRRIHRSTKEITDRLRKEELLMTCIDSNDIKAPDYLNLPSEQEEFDRLAALLSERGIYDGSLDRDMLAKYVKSQRAYLIYSDKLNVLAMNEGDIMEQSRVQKLQDTAFKQARACAQDLGLTVSARARLSIPKAEDEGDYEL